jgi:hypothetical protein
MSGRAPCRVQGCAASVEATHHLFCPPHWNATPEDLKDRLEFARLESRAETDAAVHAISHYHVG